MLDFLHEFSVMADVLSQVKFINLLLYVATVLLTYAIALYIMCIWLNWTSHWEIFIMDSLYIWAEFLLYKKSFSMWTLFSINNSKEQ